MIMTIIVTIELPVDPDKVTSVDVINRIKELIETDSLYFRWEKDEVPTENMWSDWNETLSGAVSKWEDQKWDNR